MTAAVARATSGGLDGWQSLPLSKVWPRVAGVGAFLKNTLCLIDGDRALLGPLNGDLDRPDAVLRFRADLAELVGLGPRLIAHDLHPDFPSTWGAEASGLPTLAVQHHHAHVAAVLADRGLDGPVLGLALDGFGLGPARQAWGGELLAVDGPRFRHLGGLAPLAQPGGDIAAREPWRMAAAILHKLGRGEEIAARFADLPAARLMAAMLDRGLNAPKTSSAGRLFDGVAGLLGLCSIADSPAAGPIALEAAVTRPRVMTGGWAIADDGGLDLTPLLADLAGMTAGDGADLFHGTLAAALVDWAGRGGEAEGIGRVVLCGGCFFNRVLAGLVTEGLAAHGLTAVAPTRIGPGDAGLSLGQAYVAAQTAMEGN